MPISDINGIRLFSERHGDAGPPVVLVHGSWGDHHSWNAVVQGLARTLRVLTYDRRGHSESERTAGQGSVDEDVADLAEFIAAHHFAPAHVVGNSFGASIVLKFAAAHPGMVASMTIHEPPLLALLGDDPHLSAVRQRVGAVVETLQSGNTEEGARLFVETVAFGPGMWERLPSQVQKTFVFNAPTWLDEMNDAGAFSLDLSALAAFHQPSLITRGDQSPPFYSVILDKIAAALPQKQSHTFSGAGHVPHLTHADEFVRVVAGFIETAAAANQRS